MQPLVGTPEPLPETSVLANHSSDFSLPGQSASQPNLGHPDNQTNTQTPKHSRLYIELLPQLKTESQKNAKQIK